MSSAVSYFPVSTALLRCSCSSVCQDSSCLVPSLYLLELSVLSTLPPRRRCSLSRYETFNTQILTLRAIMLARPILDMQAEAHPLRNTGDKSVVSGLSVTKVAQSQLVGIGYPNPTPRTYPMESPRFQENLRLHGFGQKVEYGSGLDMGRHMLHETNLRVQRLSGSIVSMCKWYEWAKVCLAYLSNVKQMDQFEQSRWFTRSWTL